MWFSARFDSVARHAQSAVDSSEFDSLAAAGFGANCHGRNGCRSDHHPGRKPYGKDPTKAPPEIEDPAAA
jgi:hypothetical protein